MHVKHVTIQNFKNITDLDEEIEGNIILLGDNDKGKSTFMQAIMIAAGSKDLIPANPIANGQEEAKVEVITDNEYILTAKFKKGASTPELTLTGPDGMKEKRKTVIGSILGEIDFNIDEFVNLSKSTSGKKKQVEIVEALLEDSIREDLQKIKNKIQANFDDRTEKNREIDNLKGFIKEMEVQPDWLEKYPEVKDKVFLQNKYDNALKLKNEVEGVKSRMESRAKEMTEINEKIAKLNDQHEELLDKNIDADDWLKQNSRLVPNIESLNKEISEFDEYNDKAKKVAQYNEKQKKLTDLEEESGEFTAVIQSSRQGLEDAIKDMDFPVEGLSFDLDSLLFNGVVVDPSNMSTSEIIRLGVELKIAQNPNFKVMCIEHGESLGNDKLKAIQELCTKHGYQIILEQVQRGENELKIQILPDVN